MIHEHILDEIYGIDSTRFAYALCKSIEYQAALAAAIWACLAALVFPARAGG